LWVLATLDLDQIKQGVRDRCGRRPLPVGIASSREALLTRNKTAGTQAVVFHTDAPAGFIHIDVKYLPPPGRRKRAGAP
jgi:hypothetical protein